MIYNEKIIKNLNSKELDFLLANGFRHFGDFFFRYNLMDYNNEIVNVLPLRINLANFKLSKNQKKIYKRNENSIIKIDEICITEEIEKMFHAHKMKFKSNIPESIFTFLGEDTNRYPCESKQIMVYEHDKLYSVSFLDIGESSTSSVYGIYDIEYSKKSPGIFSMLVEIEYSIKYKKEFYYPGYCYDVPSHYDYKKYFSGLEFFDWNGNWLPYEKYWTN